jgi:zinc transport system permease protein
MVMLQYDFMVRALFAGLVIGIICPALGNFLVIRRYAFMADAISHISLAGVAIGLWLGVASYTPLLVIVVAVLGALVVDYMRSHSSLSPDALLALVIFDGNNIYFSGFLLYFAFFLFIIISFLSS